ncbi:carcinoembryonic antigen-related cell adhesion molecule 6-like [Gigantopelta aegis]|uniref:carcinoembryonic antigen-related cell adhesion molecule 6-like n=1 Tax=Gigantopelta aegis TaxID=1735272 RepID=UPI001B889A7F|nr:carcinoembryonic antigen-related cell adhesion molecule 6-like [Gigantopelta aegis]
MGTNIPQNIIDDFGVPNCHILETEAVKGDATTNIDCLDSGNPGGNASLTCTITGTIVNGIEWLRPNGGAPHEVVSCNVVNTECELTVTGYAGAVVSPTQNTLIIHSFNPTTDAGEWNCRDGLDGIPSKCSKTFMYGPDLSSVNFSSDTSVEEGQYLTVDCTADCNPPCDYSWTLGDNQLTTSPLLNLTDISRNQDGNVYNCTVTNAGLPKSISKNFTLSISYDPERMSFLSAGATSGIVIAVVLALAIPTVLVIYKR